jgi:hypothetical protein
MWTVVLGYAVNANKSTHFEGICKLHLRGSMYPEHSVTIRLLIPTVFELTLFADYWQRIVLVCMMFWTIKIIFIEFRLPPNPAHETHASLRCTDCFSKNTGHFGKIFSTKMKKTYSYISGNFWTCFPGRRREYWPLDFKVDTWKP